MSNYDLQYFLAALNFVVQAAIMYSCCVRAKGMQSGDNTSLNWRMRYAVVFGVALVCSISPLTLHEWPGWGMILVSTAFLSVIGLGGTWAAGPPDYAKKNPRHHVFRGTP